MPGIEPRGIPAYRLQQLTLLLSCGREILFYSWREWLSIRSQVLELDHHECQMCKARGRYSAARIVHHVQHLRTRPDLALSIWDPDTGKRQLISVCKACHEAAHPEALRPYKPSAEPLTSERWD